MIENERIEALKKIDKGILLLKKSPLYAYRLENKYVPVPGEGSPSAHIMFVGEAPGKKEAITGKPFCGASGKILDNLLAGVGIVRPDVFITSIVKDRPPENRDPTPAEIKLYAPFLDKQIDVIQPKVIATLGRFSMEYVLAKFGFQSDLEPISKLHGKIFKTKTSYGDLYIVPLYHPAAAIYNQRLKGTLMEDFKVLKNLYK